MAQGKDTQHCLGGKKQRFDTMNHIDLIGYRRPWLSTFQLSAGFTRSTTTIATSMLERIIAAYKLARTAESKLPGTSGDVWSQIKSRYMGDLIALLERGEPAPLANYLRHLPSNDAGHGFFQGRVTYAAALADVSAQRGRLCWIVDSICGVAEALGLLPVMCPEQSGWDRAPMFHVSELIAQVEHVLGAQISVPDVCAGLLGLSVDNRVFHIRSACGAFVAWRLKEWLQQQEKKTLSECRICEIGPGIGLVPYFLRAFGATAISVFDLPELNVMQAYFLAQALPGYPLTLFGESEPRDDIAIRILPDFAFSDFDDAGFDIVLNQDSFPEIERETVLRYLRRIAKTSHYLLSINQETQAPQSEAARQLFMSDLVSEVSGMSRVYRFPFWARYGYVEEMYWCPLVAR
jgi:hypothetical protein